jgi:SAM-dependent methyltransferase
MTHFTKEYAELYDQIYGGKKYDAEVNLIDKTIKDLKPGSKVLLDYGCGTGNHATILAEKGYKIFGIDVNEDMLNIARSKFRNNSNVRFLHVNDRDTISPHSIDVCVCLFDVLSYMNANNEILEFLSFVNRVLVKDGLLFFDFWYGPGVLHLRPEQRWKEFRNGDERVLRLASPENDSQSSVVNVKYKIFVFRKDALVAEFEEVHSMRYFFPQELVHLLKQTSFDVKKFGTWKDPDRTPTTSDWSALVLAQPSRKKKDESIPTQESKEVRMI